MTTNLSAATVRGSAPSRPRFDLSARPVPTLGGFNLTVLGLELRRLARNQRTMIFTLIFPVAMFLLVSNTIPASEQSMGPGVIANTNAYVMVSMALYGAVMATTSGGAAVSIERAQGWSRQLRLTPLSPVAYIVLKMLTALVLGALALASTFVVGGVFGNVSMATQTWAEAAVIVLVGSLVFAAFGLFMGYLLPNQNAMQILGPAMALLGFLGGLFSGPVDTGTVIGKIQSLTPIYGLNQIAHWPLTLQSNGQLGSFDWSWVLNLACWGVLFVAGAVWRFRKDTARV